MIYLNNNVLQQECYVPKNECVGCGSHTGGSYKNGWNDGVAYAHSQMATGEFVENGEFFRNDGWNHVIVNVPSEANLENKNVTIDQDVTIVYPSSGVDGMMSVVVDATDYGQQKYDDGYSSGESAGFSSGYTQGSDDEKAKIGSTGFTLNGTYTKPEGGGWSAVSVNVKQTGHTDQELIDSYESGYTSGHTDGSNEEKSKLSGITITSNTAITVNSGGYSAITVNVPQTGTSLNVEQNKEVNVTANGTYVIEPTSAYTTIVRDYFDSDYDKYYLTATTSGYPSTGYFELFSIEDEFGHINGSVEVYYYNGDLDYDVYGGLDVNVDIYGNEIEIEIEDANRGFDWTMMQDFEYHYDAMSAVTVNVDVPSGTDITLTGVTINENTAITASSGTAFTSVTVNVECQEPNMGALDIITNGTYTAEDYGYDGFSAVTVDVPSDYGELYCLYCENATWGIGDDKNLNIIIMANTLSGTSLDVHLSGKTKNGTVTYTTWLDASFNGGGSSISYGLRDASYSTTGYEFPNPNTYTVYYDSYDSPRGYGANVNNIMTNKGAFVSADGHIMNSANGYFSGACFYLYQVWGNTYCPLVPAVDENGYGGLREQRKTTIYKPRTGYAWPVYRKKVNGVWKYSVVKQIVL